MSPINMDEIVHHSVNNNESPTTSQPCSRRLSRAARGILINKTLSILQHYDDQFNDKIKLSSLSFGDKMGYYSNSISNLMINPNTCLLNPQKDMFWKEENLHKITLSRHKRSWKRKLHVCGLCGKKFISKYYLDLHIDTKHHNDHKLTQSSTNMKTNYEICPAVELCKRLGPNICEQQAVLDEPYYAPGIHSHDDLYSQSVKRKHRNEAQSKPCNDESIQECYEMFETCFGDNDDHRNDALVKDLTTLFCDMQSCDTQLHSLLNSVMSIHDGREDWKKYQDEVNSFGFRHVVYIIFILIYYLGTIQNFFQRRMKKKKVWEKSKRS